MWCVRDDISGLFEATKKTELTLTAFFYFAMLTDRGNIVITCSAFEYGKIGPQKCYNSFNNFSPKI